jgi:hypothetical protein
MLAYLLLDIEVNLPVSLVMFCLTCQDAARASPVVL